MGKLKLSLDDAKDQAQQLVERLRSDCYRIQVAGSIRRRCAYVGDIELVAIPRWLPRRNLFGEEVERINCLDLALAELVADGHLLPGDKMGSLYKKFVLPHFGLQVDLYVTDTHKWGMIFTQRTGSKDFSHWLVTPRYKGGALPSGMRVRGGRIWRNGEALATPEERDVFRALEIDWIEPPRRIKGLWNTYRPRQPFDETVPI